MFSIFAQLPRTKAEIEAHVAALVRAHKSVEHHELFQHLYGCLTILDDKSASLLSFNSIVIAVYAIVMTASVTTVGFFIAGIGMATVTLSSILLMSVVWIHWSTTEDLQDLDQHAHRLLHVRRSRTIRYRLAWWLSMAGILTLGAGLARALLLRV
jgi:hypothetical protein